MSKDCRQEMVLHLSNDLMLVGKVSAWAKSNGIGYKNVKSIAQFRGELVRGVNENSVPNIAVVLVDLQLDQFDSGAFVVFARNELPNAKLVGYAQHVKVDLIEAAQNADFDSVLTRGQFDKQFARIIADQLARRSPR